MTDDINFTSAAKINGHKRAGHMRYDEDTVYVALVGKRNDDDVYKHLRRKY